jgi:outer membrane PBP1 activator LpoA protein
VVGPLSKQQVEQLSIHGNYPVTTLALNYTDQSKPDPHFFQFGLSQQDEARQLAEKAFQAGKSNAIIIASKEAWSQYIVKTLSERWIAQGGKIVDTYQYSTRAHFTQDIAKLMGINPTEDRAQMNDDNTKNVLQKQRRQDFDTIFLIALPQQGREIVPLLKYYYADHIPIYSTSIIYSGSPSPQKDADLNGVIFCDIPWVLNKPSKSQHNRLYAVGRDAELLSSELERLAILPHFPLHAATGALSLNDKQQIYRQVPWTEMHAGHP